MAVAARRIRQIHERTAAMTGILRAGCGNDPRLEALWHEWQARHLAAVSQVAVTSPPRAGFVPI